MKQFILPPLLFLAALGLALGSARAQSVPAQVRYRAREAFHGADLVGKDGPMVKIGFHLTQLHFQHRAFQHAGKTGPFVPFSSLFQMKGNRVVIDAFAANGSRTATLLSDMEALGLQNAATAGPVVSGSIPVEALDELAALKELRFARPAVAMTLIGQTTSQGVQAMRADAARRQFGVDGSGVTVGVLSDSYDQDADARTHASDDQASDDLPQQVQVLDDSDAEGGDEGRAMMQLIYDVAPGVNLAFHTADGGLANYAQGIRELRDVAGADVIVDDVFYFQEPMFQDGRIAQAVDSVVNDGAVYFSSAGNANVQSYESERGFDGTGQTGPLGGELHDFDPGPATDSLQQVTIPQGSGVTITFQWDQPYASAGLGQPGSASDLDIFIADQHGDTLAAGQDDNNMIDAISVDNGNPTEVFAFRNDGSVDANGDGTPDETFNIGIEHQSGPEAGFMKYIFYGGMSVDEYFTTGSTIFGHANATGAEAIGAASYMDTPAFGESPPVLRGFSSAGGTPTFFNEDGTRKSNPETRRKPELVAPDEGNNTFIGGDIPEDANDGDCTDPETGASYDCPNFSGTSGSSPHATGAAALIRERNPNQGPQALYDDMEQAAIDMNNPYNGPSDDPGFDFATGYGLVQADAPLPVELTVFAGHADGSSIVLAWRTASETNNARFEIQRKRQENASSWQTIGERRGAGTTSEEQQYTFTDDALPFAAEAITYRLRQIDRDGDASSLSDPVTVQLGVPSRLTLHENYPNPFAEATTFRYELPRTAKVRLVVYDVLGRAVAVPVEERQEAGAHEVTWSAEELPAGTYAFRLQAGGRTQTKQMVRVR